MTTFRPGGDPLGVQRVIAPAGLLPQAALRLDPDLPAWSNEVVLDVLVLNVDAASFAQLEQVEADGGPPVADQITAIVRARGKMQNPETGSGGMLLGRVGALGPDYDGPLAGTLAGTPVASLVSLTLTPLHLDAIVRVDRRSHQVHVQGRAILPPSAPCAVLPADFDPTFALSILDVCGAPALVDRWARGLPDRGHLVVIGCGKAGVLSLCAARRARPDLHLWAIDRSAEAAGQVADAGLCDGWASADATDAIAIHRLVDGWTGGGADAVINMASLPGTEMATVLAARQRGVCLFFGMATSFARVALGAEGVGRDVDLVIGNGYAIGHAAFALDLVRGVAAARHLLQRRLGAALT